jgi:Fe-S-cluster containining protein
VADLDAGDFGTWLTQTRVALKGEADADVPCDGCTACCTSSQFVHIEPDEIDTIAHIPSDLLFPAPRLPLGNFVLGYDERGHCPMLIDGMCSIYEHRPRTCRVYDCRVYAAAGVEPDDERKVEITKRVRQWRFSYRSSDDEARRDTIREKASTLEGNPGERAAKAITTADG